MADDNQQPENNEPLENNQWEEKEWQAKMDYAKEVLARQQAEAERTKAASAQQTEAKNEDAEDEGSQEEQEAEWSARLAMAKNSDRNGAGASPESNQAAQVIKELDVIDKTIAELNKKVGTEYAMIYLYLTTTAAIVDLLQAVADVSVVLALLASAGGIGFSVVRHYGLKYANPAASSEEHAAMLKRTLIYGAVSMLPYVDILPELTVGMLREWTVKKESIAGTNEEIRKLKEKRKKLAASLKNMNP